MFSNFKTEPGKFNISFDVDTPVIQKLLDIYEGYSQEMELDQFLTYIRGFYIS
jgi:hypothetical protein